MWQVLVIIFASALAIYLVKAWLYWVTICALMKYIEEKQHTRPSSEEISMYVKWTIRKMLHFKGSR